MPMPHRKGDKLMSFAFKTTFGAIAAIGILGLGTLPSYAGDPAPPKFSVCNNSNLEVAFAKGVGDAATTPAVGSTLPQNGNQKIQGNCQNTTLWVFSDRTSGASWEYNIVNGQGTVVGNAVVDMYVLFGGELDASCTFVPVAGQVIPPMRCTSGFSNGAEVLTLLDA